MSVNECIQPGKRAAVVGMGVSGRAMVTYLLRSGVNVAVSDSRDLEELPETDRALIKEKCTAFEGGGHSASFLVDSDYVVVSPGVPLDMAVLAEVRKKNIPIIGELALAAPHLNKEMVVAVTGTNGKTTVTALIAELLRASGRKVFVGGNIGTPVLEYVFSEEKADVLVLELSSFQLESAGGFRPNIGVLLNITPDHLDRHKSMENYTAAKLKLFSGQHQGDKAVLCNDAELIRKVHALADDVQLYCFAAEDSSCAVSGKDNVLTVRQNGQKDLSYDLAETSLNSYTGMLNAQAAVLTATLLGCDEEGINKGLHSFCPAPHRLQFVRELAGVQYFDDSKATNSGALLSALHSFSDNVILIAGGKEKGEDFSVLRDAVRAKVKAVVLIGEAADSLETVLAGVTDCSRVRTMQEAVVQAEKLAAEGDVVLLAPACASFDMFDNYGQRGDVFKEAVMDICEAGREAVLS